jgi:hypothetical protein
MAKYRQIHTSFWQDSFVMELTPEEKYFFVYLMTNSKTTQCGIYEIPLRVIEMETGYNRETVDKLINRFEEYGKIIYSKETKEVCIINWMKYNFIDSYKVKACIEREIEQVKNKSLLGSIKGLSKVKISKIDDLIPATINKRQAVWVRDRGLCQYTQKEISSNEVYEVDHIIPDSRNGSSRYENLVATFREINLKKSDCTPEECGLPVPTPNPYHGKTAISDLVKNPDLLNKFNRLFGKEYFVDNGQLFSGKSNIESILNQYSRREEEKEEELNTNSSQSEIDRKPIINNEVSSINSNKKNSVESKAKREDVFNKWWSLYDKKVNKKKCLALFLKLKEADIESMRKHTPKYVKMTEKKFRKDPERYLRLEAWNDEIVGDAKKQTVTPTPSFMTVDDYNKLYE